MNHWSVEKLDGGPGEPPAAWDALNWRKLRRHPMLDSRFADALLPHFSDGGESLCVLEQAGAARSDVRGRVIHHVGVCTDNLTARLFDVLRPGRNSFVSRFAAR